MRTIVRFREEQELAGSLQNAEDEGELTLTLNPEEQRKLNVRFNEQEQRFGTIREREEQLRIGFRNVQTITRMTDDYGALRNKPSINEHQLTSGENTLASLLIGKCGNTDINRLF